MLRIGTIVLGVDDMRRAVEFWTRALGYVVRDDGIGETWTSLLPVGGSGVQLGLQLSETPAREHPRVHLDLDVDSAAEQEAEVDRLVGLGAQRVDWDMYPKDPDFVVLADTEGNRFCVVDLSHG